MFSIFYSLLRSLRVWFRSKARVQLEIISLGHQLAVLHRKNPKPMLTAADRFLWVWLSRTFANWRSVLLIVKPETVIAWHRQGFRWYWNWKIRRGQSGRPSISKETRDLIRTISRDNPTWGAPRIHGELLKLAIHVSESSVAKYMVRLPKPPSQTWRTFLSNHASQLVSVDFFTVPTISFHILYFFIVLSHNRRHILHFNVTAHPTAKWTSQQIVEAFPFDSAPRYLLRDNDQIYGCEFRRQLEVMGNRWKRIRRPHAKSNPLETSSLFLKSADCIIGTNVERPEFR
jgi:hypothetical protein